MKLNWTVIPEPTRTELKKLARKMRRQGYVPQINFHGAGKWSLDGHHPNGGTWIA